MANDTCAVCGASSFKTCACPWDKPFTSWPAELIRRMRGNFTHGSSPHPNS